MTILISRLKPQRDKVVKQLNKSKKAKLIEYINKFITHGTNTERFPKIEFKPLRSSLVNIKTELDKNRSCLNKFTIKMVEALIEEFENYVILMELAS